jgi:vancomycin resistance protein YoaR
MAMGINEILDQYKAKIKELLDISQKLGQIRKQKLAAEYDVREMDARIIDIKSQAAVATQPEEKQKFDALLNEAQALLGQSKVLLDVATNNEAACVTDARLAESQVKELSSKLQEGKDKK